MSVAIIINPKAGPGGPAKGRQRVELATAVLAQSGEPGEVLVTDCCGHARNLAAAAVKRGARLVVAWGGDGTINEVATSLAYGPAALGIVRSGSGNSLARELGVSARPERALRDAMAAVPRAIDAGEIDGHRFFCVAGIGFDEHIASCFERDASGRRGFATYVRIATRELLGYRPSAYSVDDRTVTRAMLITIANAAQFGNGARVAPRARVDDGWLDLVTFDERSRFATCLAVPRLFVGGLDRVRGVTMTRVERTTIKGDRPIRFHVDGEPRQGGTRIDVRVLPSALRVAVR
jgi:YegS/Rv2252/BmrU family lipid kinase